jgi:hypothetical protein
VQERFEPDAGRHARYLDKLARYQALRERLAEADPGDEAAPRPGRAELEED